LSASLPSDGKVGPSSFYHAGLWRLGLAVARALPLPVCLAMGATAGSLYGALHRQRREIVAANLRPLLDNNSRAAKRAARGLFRNFGRKLADLMRLEAGVPVKSRFLAFHHWERFEAAHVRQQGVLLLTPHLGNWEIGGPLLVERGVNLLVITQAEPGEEFTEMRRAARERWGVETLVIGRDAFAFIEIIQRLQAGATVAMLVDRPAGPTGVEVEFCGRPFLASVAPAELARASGCALIGVQVVAQAGGYAADVLPEFTYDRRELGQREARRELTGRIMKAFEPTIREHADQWYHFVPIWPKEPKQRERV
jgi:lauroyl/myristoyl acyltransferase